MLQGVSYVQCSHEPVESVHKKHNAHWDMTALPVLALSGRGYAELRIDGVLGGSPVESSSRPQQTASGRLTPLSQGRQDVLGAAVLTFRESLAQLTDERARHAVALEPSEHSSLRAGNCTPSRYLPTWVGRRFLKKSTSLRLLLADRWPHGSAARYPDFRFRGFSEVRRQDLA